MPEFTKYEAETINWLSRMHYKNETDFKYIRAELDAIRRELHSELDKYRKEILKIGNRKPDPFEKKRQIIQSHFKLIEEAWKLNTQAGDENVMHLVNLFASSDRVRSVVAQMLHSSAGVAKNRNIFSEGPGAITDRAWRNAVLIAERKLNFNGIETIRVGRSILNLANRNQARVQIFALIRATLGRT